ncbi:MAG: hypothetical protein ABIZ81_09880 [Opitutaceae bacterium]
MSNRRLPNLSVEKVDLMRGGAVATSLLGAFGVSLKETRLTAWLGFLLAARPEAFLKLFGFQGRVTSVQLELRHADGRSDILVETDLGCGVIEAKVDATDASEQLKRYGARWGAVLALCPGRFRAGVRFIHWQQLAEVLRATKFSPVHRFLSDQLISYLEEHSMIKKKESLEIYAREINEPVTLRLFMQGRIYGCKYEKGNKLVHSQYFAPHFGGNLAREHAGIFQGISYVARIEQVFFANSWNYFKAGVCEHRGKTWWNSHEELLNELHKEWPWLEEDARSFLLLNEPRLAFNPPVRKERPQKGKGWLSKRFFSFDELFAAWGK